MNFTSIFWSSVVPPMRHFTSEKKKHLQVSYSRLCVLSKWLNVSSSLSGYRLPEVFHAVSRPHRNCGGLRQWQRAGGLLQQHRLPGPLCEQALQVLSPSHTLGVQYAYCSTKAAKKQCLYLIFWNGPQQPSGVGKCGPEMLISSGIPPPPAHMSESLIKMGSGLSSWLSRWVSPPDNINELGFQAALYDVNQLLRLTNRMNASCLNEDLIWHTYTRIIPHAWGHEPLGQFKLTIADQHQASERFPVFNAGHCWRVCLFGRAAGPTRSLSHVYCFCVSMNQLLLYCS